MLEETKVRAEELRLRHTLKEVLILRSIIYENKKDVIEKLKICMEMLF